MKTRQHVYWFIIALLTCLPACTEKYKTCGVAIRGGVQESIDGPDYFFDKIEFNIYAYNQRLACGESGALLVNHHENSYRQPSDWEVLLNTASFEITFNKSFLFNADTMPPGNNILAIPQVSVLAEKSVKTYASYCHYTLTIPVVVLQHLTFDTGIYHVFFKCTTTQGQFFEAERDVVFKQ